MRRLATMKSAYVMSAVLASLLGSLGYFQLYFPIYPGLEVFSLNNRALAGFKDPNVLGVFLIPPLMWLIEGFIIDKVRPRHVLAGAIMLVGLLLSFSRAAWGGFLFTTAMTLSTIFFLQRGKRTRTRIIALVLMGALVMIVIAAALLSVDVVYKMFMHRTTLQEYDLAGDRGRFDLQVKSINEILVNPMGMGPWGFAKVYGMVSHNSFLGTLLNHGWIGGFAYTAQVLLTLVLGFRAALVRTPWQTFLIATYYTYFALVLEAFVVDTDHWRHYYLLQGIVWGLVVATINFASQRQRGHDAQFAHSHHSGNIYRPI